MNIDPMTQAALLKLNQRMDDLSARVDGVVDAVRHAGGMLRLQYPIFETRTWTAPADGHAVVAIMSGAGGGARGASATGGYSASWATKALRVSKGQPLAVVIGAGGAAQATANSNGNGGGDSSITIDGVTHSTPGGPGGVYVASGAPITADGPISIDQWWDMAVASVRPGSVASGATGGAGVDILAQGNNATTSASITSGGGGGTGAPSVGSTGGGALPGGLDALGSATRGSSVLIQSGLWMLPFWGGNGGDVNGGNGGNGGGGGNYNGANTGRGGVGGGGGGGSAGAGGKGYCCISFYPDAPA
jgi:hypothetical protein